MAFGLYCLPTDDLAGPATVTASDPDTGYPAQNLVAPSGTGHYNLPSRPAKLASLDGYFDLVLPAPITIAGVALIYHNFDAGLDVTLDVGSNSPPSSSIAIPIPAKPDPNDDWTFSPWVLFDDPITDDAFRLSINEPNSLNVQIGRLLLLAEFRQLETDVRYGGTEEEDRIMIRHETEIRIETIYDLGDVRRRFDGTFGFRQDETDALRALWRSAKNRVLPWLLIEDATVNDAKFVRFEDAAYSSTHDTIGFHSHPFRVRELSRGIPWP